MKVNVVSKRRSIVGEGPHWDGQGGLWHVDVMAGEICKLNVRSQETETKKMGGYASLVIPYSSNPSNRLLVSKDRQLRCLEWESSEESLVLVEPETGNTRFNDGKCDNTGKLWVGTMGIETAPAVLEPFQGNLYSMGKDLKVHHHLDKISISNGLAWSKDNKTLFFIDSLAREVTAFNFDQVNGSISNPRTLHKLDIEDGYPDGMCIDTGDQIWVACFAGSKVIGIDTATGTRTCTIQLPASRITSCCFGGDDYQDMYVTSAKDDQQTSGDGGAVFCVTGLGVKSFPPNNFCG